MPHWMPSLIRLKPFPIGLGLAIAFAICMHTTCDAGDQDRLARLRLKNGEYIDGRAVPWDDSNYLGWQSPHFLSPLDFDWRNISSVEFYPYDTKAESKDPFRFLLDNGSVISGNLAKLDEAEIWIDSSSLGQLHLERNAVRQIEAQDRSLHFVYEGPRSIDGWQSEWPEAWSFQHGVIQSNATQSSVRLAVDLPAISLIEFRLAWDTRPEFELSLGVEKVSKDPLTAARLEVWDGQLTIVRESGKNADIAILSKLADGAGHVELKVYLNQQTGLVSVYSPSGEMLVKLSVPFEQPVTLGDVLVTIGGEHQRVEKLNIYRWDGKLPDPSESASAIVVQRNGSIARGQIKSFDKAASTLVTDDAQAEPIKLANVERITMAKTATKRSEIADEPPTAADSKSPDQVEGPSHSIDVRMRDGSRISGTWLGVNPDGSVPLSIPGLGEPVTFNIDQLATILGTRGLGPTGKAVGKLGRLYASGVQLSGQLVVAPLEQSTAVLGWQPAACTKSAAINPRSSGTINFFIQKALDAAASITGNRVQQAKELEQAVKELARLNAPPIAQKNAAQRPQNALPNLPAPEQRKADVTELYRMKYGLMPTAGWREEIGILMRSGDRIAGDVVKIDGHGVEFNSTETTTKFVTHSQIQSLVLARTHKPLKLSAERLQRILTVPRISKNDPPTHLLIATNGDYLRGRLLRLDGETATVEVRLENVELPRKAVAQIIWLHDRDWTLSSPEAFPAKPEEMNQNATNAAPLVHAVLATGATLTFSPTSISNEKLTGNSPLLGECSVEIKDLNQLLFGHDSPSRALELQQESWKLSLARNPKVLDAERADQTGAPRASQRAPLVGKAAPNFVLKDLGGNDYEMHKHQGRVKVLDFWASWCAPCMASMPEVARVVSDVGSEQVDLVTVNYQETPERIHATINKLGLTATAILDADGDVAELYDANAIPQTVIIDRDGIVRHVFVGGGSKFVPLFQAALKEVVETK